MNSTLTGIDVVILCGGMGTRLKTAVGDRPKALASIGEHPFLDILIQQFQSFGFRRFVLCTGYQGDAIAEHMAERRDSIDVVLSQESHPLGTAGAVKRAEDKICSDPFVVTNGDSLCQADLAGFVDFHRAREAALSMVLARTDDPHEFGSVRIQNDGRILSYREKQTNDKTSYINAGIYLFRPQVLESIPPDTKCSLEYDHFPKLIADKVPCYGFVTDVPIADIGTPERLMKARHSGLGKCQAQ